MNIHFVALRRRNNFLQRVLNAVNSVGYRIERDDRLFMYTNLCLESIDIYHLCNDLGCEVILQPLSSDEHVALSNLPNVVTAHARNHPDDANLLIDNDGISKRGRAIIIPSYSSKFRG